MKNLEDRILEISKKYHTSHIGSCLSLLPILEEIYKTKKRRDAVILDGAHAHLAHLVVQEYYEHREDIERTFTVKGIHCDREAGCDVSGGSLGHGIGIGIGLALADPERHVHCIVTDGSMMEGSNWEALRILDALKIKNMTIYCNFNGFTALDISDRLAIEYSMRSFGCEPLVYWTDNTPHFQGLKGHYITI